MVTPTGQEAIASAAGSVVPDTPGALLSVEDVRVTDDDRLTPDAVADDQARWSGLFQ